MTRHLARELDKRGHRVRVLANRYPRTLADQELIDGVEITRWHFLSPRLEQLLNLRFDLFLAGLLYFPLTLARLVLLLRRERPDTVNLHFVGAPALFVLLARWFIRFRLIVSLHGDDVEGLARRRRLDLAVFRSILRQADVVTACSQYLLDKVDEQVSLAGNKGRVVHNGIELSKKMKTPAQQTGILAVGRLFPAKGFDVLLRAHAAIKEQALLTLVGDGPERAKLQELALSLGLNGDFRFIANQDQQEVMNAIANAAVVAIPSRRESFGLVALEAMACGKPVVATRVGGLPEVLAGADALLVEPESAPELAHAIEAALRRVKSDPHFGARNRRCAERFSISRMTDGYLEAYDG